jgi:hypothetical protein
MTRVCILAGVVLVGLNVVPASAQRSAPAGERPAGLAPSGTYNAGGRRDPFVSLLKSGSDPGGRGNVPRPPGVAGLFVSEVALKGVVVSPSGYSALLQGTDTRTYVVHVGDRLMDGQVRSIGADSLVLLQRSSDPLVVPKEVEIRKRLRQVGEGKP